MKRYIDPLFFLFLLVLDIVGCLVVLMTKALPATDLETMPPMTVALVIVIAAPVLASMSVIALARVLLKVPPRPFWSWMSGITVAFAVFTGVAFLITTQMSLQLGFLTGIWSMSIAAFCSIVMLFLAAVGALPEPDTIVEDTVIDQVDTTVEETIVDEVPGQVGDEYLSDPK